MGEILATLSVGPITIVPAAVVIVLVALIAVLIYRGNRQRR